MALRRWLGSRLAAGTLLGLAAVLGAWALAADNNAVEERMRKDITFLASDECEGRGVTTKGINLAADYIAKEFKKAGLKPGGPDGSYFQPFKIPGRGQLGAQNQLVLKGPLGQEIRLKLGEHFQVMGLSGSGQVSGPVVFAGYGITAKNVPYDDYAPVDVAGKVVVILRREPRAADEQNAFEKDPAGPHNALDRKLVNGDLQKAAAILFVNDRDLSSRGDVLMSFRNTGWIRDVAEAPAVHVRREVVDAMLQSSLGTCLKELEEDIDRDLRPRSALLKGWTADVQVSVKRDITPAKNVIGVLEGSGPLAKETVVIGAHYDHLGYGGAGSLARGSKAIHHGADDNGSGSTAVMELARRFGQMPNRQGRRLVFMTFSGEELGLLGSAYYCSHPLFPLKDTVAMVNLDMVGRLRPDKDTNRDSLEVHGTGTAKGFSELIDELNQKFNFKLIKQAGGIGPSDHASFYQKKIPVFFFFTGTHPDYHRPSDTSDKINVPGMRRVTDLAEAVIARLASTSERPQYVLVRQPARIRSGGPRGGPRLGIMPDYNDDKEGLLISSVVPEGPAAKAGLKDGDRIVEVAGKPVKNIQVYMVLMRDQKRDQPIEVTVLRGGKKINLKVKPE
jgi:hypothetical protein